MRIAVQDYGKSNWICGESVCILGFAVVAD
jgi:hypothetical protein